MRSSILMYLVLYWLHTVMWIASARYALVLVFIRSWVHGCLFRICVRRNTRDDFCLTCVEQPSCHSPGMEVAHGLYPPIFGKSMGRNKSIFFKSRNDLSMMVEQHSVLMSELWFPYESIASVCSSSFYFLWSSPCVFFQVCLIVMK